MALLCDELECNSFFRTLQTKYVRKFEQAQKKSWIICVPCQKSIMGVYISQELIDTHILKPSPFYKNHFLSTDPRESRSFELENGVITISGGGGKVKILTEEIGYNDDYKPYKVLVIQQPLSLDSVDKKGFGNSNKSLSGVGSFFQPSECLKLLQSYPDALNMLDKKIYQFCSSYMVLPDYLPDAAIKLRSIIDCANLIFSQSSKQGINRLESSSADIALSVEYYTLNRVHSKVYPVIKKMLAEEDKEITDKLFSLYEAGISPDQLGVKEPFCCQTPSAVVELASLNLKSSPSEKLICLMTTLELLNQDIDKSLQEIYSPLNPNKDVPCISSDDLIPLLINVMVQARPMYLASNLYFVQNFCWHLSVKDKLSFSLVTFQAAKEFLKSNAIKLKKSLNKIKKEMTLEELIQMTVEMQDTTKLNSSKRSANSNHSTIDNQLENVTKMIEASTRELNHRQWPDLKDFT